MTRRAAADLERLRRRIDALDRRIGLMLVRRLALVERLAPFKGRLGDARREAAVLRNVQEAAGGGPWRGEFLLAVYRSVLRASRRYQARRRRA